MKLSVSIISFNEENNIRRTLEALQGVADEIVLLDSFSTDKTTEIAASMGATVYQEPWAGYLAQKNSALDKCSGEWILCLDSDEVLTPELLASIKAVLAGKRPAGGYRLKRRTIYMGKLLKYAWQPDRHLRLVHRSASPRWAGTDPHESLVIDGPVSDLDGYLSHYSYRNFADHMEKTRKYAEGAAKTYFKRGKKARSTDLFMRPPFVLFKRLVLQRALLDGTPGVIAAFSSAVYSYMKYSFLWEMQNTPAKDKK